MFTPSLYVMMSELIDSWRASAALDGNISS